MKPFRSILFPVDFSDGATALAPCVKEMAQRFDASVTVFHAFNLVIDYVLAPSLDATYAPERTVIPYTPDFEELRDIQRKRLDAFALAQLSGVKYATRFEDGDPATLIESIAEREKADVIFMPTKGAGKFRRLLLGSVTSKVLHDVDCPVLTSTHEAVPAAGAGLGFRSIVCAIELNQEADVVLQAACMLAKSYGAKLCVLHMGSESSQPNQPDPADLVRNTLERATDGCGASSPVEVSVRVLDAGVPEGIHSTTVEEKADLLVVGRGRERETLARMWSHLYTILREAPCPVLSV